MRFHRLSLAGIGPFAERQDLDLDALAEQGLFLLTGPTGAGKTTLLDAIVFALYGSVPGSRGRGRRGGKGASERIVSDLRDPSTQPEVELEFSVGSRRFLLHRVAQHQRPKQRGEGRTMDKGSVRLSELVDGAWSPRSASFDEVGSEIGGLTGMTAVQFAQVVLLPQGEFAGFLRADVDDRRAILQRLFRVEEYEQAEAWLRERAQDARVQAEDGRRRVRELADRLAGALEIDGGLPDDRAGDLDAVVSWVAGRAAGEAEVLELRGVDARTAQSQLELASTRLEQTRLVAQRTRELTAAEQPLAEQEARLPRARDWIREQVGSDLADDEDRWRDAADAASERYARLTERLEDGAQATAMERDAQLADEAAAQAEARRDELEARVQQLGGALREARDRASQGLVDEETLTAAERALDEARRVATAAASRDELRSRVSGLRIEADAGEAEARTAETELAGLPSEADAEASEQQARTAEAAAERQVLELSRRVDELRSTVERADAVIAQGTELRGELRLAVEARDAARAASLDAREALARAREARLDAMAAELAEQLGDGEPCPVCGGTEHPAPAHDPGGDEVRARELDAQEATERAAARLEQAEAIRSGLEGRIAALDLDTRARDLAEAQRELQRCEPQLEAAREAAGRATTVAVQAAQRVAAVRAARQRADERRRAADDRAHQLGLAGAQLDAATREAGDHEDPPALVAQAERRLAELRTRAGEGSTWAAKRDELEASLERTRREKDAAVADVARERARGRSARAGAGQLRERLAELARPHDTIEQAVRAARERARGMRGAVALLEELASLQGVVVDARASLAAARDAEPVDEDEPERLEDRLARRESEASAAERRRDETAARLQDARRRVDAVVKARERADALRRELGPAAEQAERLIRLDLAVRGQSGDNRRAISLTTYVLAARLEEVAGAATRHLERMSNGRYALQHHDERDGRKQAGLGLRVLDAYSGEHRDTATLSGGEAFYASLALALGLADVVQREAGGRPLETLLVDEGFGSLDADTLEEVLSELDELRAAGRVVGVVSHVPAMAERIPSQLQVTPGPRGSTARVVTGVLG